MPQAVEHSPVRPLPHPGLVPLSEPAPAGHARTAAHLLGELLPGGARPEYEQDAGKGGAIIDAGSATLWLRGFLRQERLYDLPQLLAHQFFGHALDLPATRFC